MFLDIIKSLRLINLLMLALSQVLAYYAVYLPFWKRATDVSPEFSEVAFWLSLVAAIFVMAFGNIQNDWMDKAADQAYGKKNFFLSIKNPTPGIAAMVILPILAFGIGIYLHLSDSLPNFWMIIIGATIALLSYNLWYKSIPVIGNLVVAVLSAVGAMLPLLLVTLFINMEDSSIQYMLAKSDLLDLSLVYGGFCLAGSFTREVLKDFEDMDRDQAAGLTTLATAGSIRLVKAFISIPLFASLFGLSFTFYHSYTRLNMVEMAGWGILILMNLGLALWILNLNTPRGAKWMSSGIKLFLLLGLSTMAWLPLSELLFYAF